jgi:hypothetical protein
MFIYPTVKLEKIKKEKKVRVFEGKVKIYVFVVDGNR